MHNLIATKLPEYTDVQWLVIKAKQAIIESTKGTIFSVKFIKATTGELREMTCIYQEHTHEALANNRNRRLGYDQMLVQELAGLAYKDRPKTINLGSILSIKERGNVHVYS